MKTKSKNPALYSAAAERLKRAAKKYTESIGTAPIEVTGVEIECVNGFDGFRICLRCVAHEPNPYVST